MTFDELCKEGDAADALLNEQRFPEAERAYQNVLAQAKDSGVLDSFIVSKVALGLLMCMLGQSRDAEAHALWTKELKDGPLGMGIWGLENGQTSTHDLIVYFLVSAYLHSLSTDPESALSSVDDLMHRVSGYALEDDNSFLPILINNWNRHLEEIFEGQDIPDYARADLQELETRFGGDPGLPTIAFPHLSPWVVDWNGPDDEVTSFSPDGTVSREKRSDAEGRARKKRGFFSRLFGRN